MNQNNEDKLDWMYKGAKSHVNEEEYLLGKSVDKTFEQLNNEKKEKKFGIAPPKNHVEHECIPPSIRDFNKIVQEEQVDLSAKLQEDPLAAIKKREEEARRQFLQNPIQLKKLQEALEAQRNKKKKKKKKKDDLDKKLSKKLKNLKGDLIVTSLLKNEKKQNHLDTILMHKFNQLKEKLSQKDMDDILAGKCSSDSDKEVTNKQKNSDSEDSDQTRRNRQYTRYKSEKVSHKKEYISKDRRRARDSSSSSEYEKKKYKEDKNKPRKYKNQSDNRTYDKKNYKKSSKKHRDSSSSSEGEKVSKQRKLSDKSVNKHSYDDKKQTIEESDPLDKMILEKLRMIRDSKTKKVEVEQPTYSHYDSDEDQYVYKKKSFGLVRSDGTKIPLKSPAEIIKPAQKKTETIKPPEKRNQSKKLSDKEKEEIRKQMMVDAVKRDKERSDNLKKFNLENKIEESKVEEFDKNFIHKELSKSQQKILDVESRIKSKLNNIQRSSQHMNSNFSKRS